MKLKKPLFGAKSAPLSTQALAEQAQRKQEQHYYKEAIEIYKELLKRETNSLWQQNLGECYLQRALALAEKGMEKEAVVLWENYAGYSQQPQHNELYLLWLLHNKSHAKIKNYLKGLSVQMIDETYLPLASLLSVWVISGVDGIYQALPAESAFVKQSLLALETLTAYKENRLADVESNLKKFPFRSAYKDFRSLLKAALLFNSDVTQANSLLNTIAKDSPYQAAVQLFQISQQAHNSFIPKLMALSTPQQIALGQLCGWSNKQFKLFQAYSRESQKLTPSSKFNLTLDYKELLGTTFTQRFCQALLIAHSGLEKTYEKNIARLNDFEKYRLRALAAEQKKDWELIEKNWSACIRVLQQHEPENALKIALIFRHLAKISPERYKLTTLEKSLEYDKLDKDTHLALLKSYTEGGLKEKLILALETALELFPKEIEVLQFAMLQAKKEQAFKKVTQLAERILSIDAVNIQAKDCLFHSHLDYARQQFKKKKFDLCHKELAKIEPLSLNSRYQNIAQILQGLLLFTVGDKKDGAALIHSACLQLDEGNFVAYYRVNHESLLLGVPISTLLRNLPPLAKNYVISETEINHFMQVLTSQKHENSEFIHKAIEKVKAVFKQSLKKQPFAEKTMLDLCEVFDKIAHFELMRYCVSLTNFKTPIWEFYKLYAKLNGDASLLKPYEVTSLERQLYEAREQDDHKAARFIQQFLEKQPRRRFLFEDIDIYEDDDDDDEDLVAYLFEDVPEEIMEKLYARIGKFDTQNPMKMINLISQYVSPMDLMMIMSDKESLSALLLIIAADQLGIDIGVDVDDLKSYLGDYL